jgi:hypothetical protein
MLGTKHNQVTTYEKDDGAVKPFNTQFDRSGILV